MSKHINKITKEIYTSFTTIYSQEEIKENPDELFYEFLNDYLFISITKIINSDKKEEEKKELLYFLRNTISSIVSSYNLSFVYEDEFKNLYKDLKEFTPSDKEIKHFSKVRKEYPLIENIYNQFLDTSYSSQMLLLGKETKKEEIDVLYKEINQRLGNLPIKFDEDNFTEKHVFDLRNKLFRAEGYILLFIQELYGKKDLKGNFKKAKVLFTKEEKIELGKNLFGKAYDESLKAIYKRITSTEDQDKLPNLQIERKKRRKIIKQVKKEDQREQWVENVLLAPMSNGLNVKNDSLNLIVDMAGKYNENLSTYTLNLLNEDPQNNIVVSLCYQEETQDDMKSVEEVLEKLQKLSSYPYPLTQSKELTTALKKGEYASIEINDNLYGIKYDAGSYFIEDLSKPFIKSISYKKNGELITINKHEILENTLSDIISSKNNTNQLEVRIESHGSRNKLSLFDNGKKLIKAITPTIISSIPTNEFGWFSLNLNGCILVHHPNKVKENSNLKNTFAPEAHEAFGNWVVTKFQYGGKPIERKNIETHANIYNVSAHYVFLEDNFERKKILYPASLRRFSKNYSEKKKIFNGFFMGRLRYKNGKNRKITEEGIFEKHSMVVPTNSEQTKKTYSSIIIDKIARLVKSVVDYDNYLKEIAKFSHQDIIKNLTQELEKLEKTFSYYDGFKDIKSLVQGEIRRMSQNLQSGIDIEISLNNCRKIISKISIQKYSSKEFFNDAQRINAIIEYRISSLNESTFKKLKKRSSPLNLKIATKSRSKSPSRI